MDVYDLSDMHNKHYVVMSDPIRNTSYIMMALTTETAKYISTPILQSMLDVSDHVANGHNTQTIHDELFHRLILKREDN